jgi:hypothetical protein
MGPRHPRVDGTIPLSGKHGAAGQLATKRISVSSRGPINNIAGQDGKRTSLGSGRYFEAREGTPSRRT